LYLAGLRVDGLSQGEAHILAHLATASPATIADLHRGLAHKRSTLTSILDRLVERGLVTREVSAIDRRTFIITVTPAGKEAARLVHRHLKDLEEAIGAKVTAADVKSFLKVLALVEGEAHRRTQGGRGR
jgi:DNA-binding MarR family transcriptional regulator